MSDEDRLAKLEAAIERNEAGGAPAQARAVQEYLLTEPSQPAADRLWTILVSGLLALIGLLAVALFVLVLAGKSTDAVLPVLTALSTGLLGLFVNKSNV